jgi:YggT family protein
MYIIGYPLLAIVNILDTILLAYSFIVLAVCVLSFVNPDPSNPIVKVLRQLTAPVFGYIGRYLPSISGIDLSPFVVFIALSFIRTGILPIFTSFASGLVN